MPHPNSSALRQIADQLDELADAGTIADCRHISMKIRKKTALAMARHFGVTLNPNMDFGDYGCVAEKRYGEFSLNFYAHKPDLFAYRTVTREVTEYVLDVGDAVEVAASAVVAL